MVLGLGIDVVDIEEFRSGPAASHPDVFFLPDELEYARTQARSWENLGARLAAKRAVFRALGVEQGVGSVSASGPDPAVGPDPVVKPSPEVGPAWHEVEIVRRESGELDVRLSGGALALAESKGASVCRVSMTHTRRTALATAILEGEQP